MTMANFPFDRTPYKEAQIVGQDGASIQLRLVRDGNVYAWFNDTTGEPCLVSASTLNAAIAAAQAAWATPVWKFMMI
jgi:hypothetical protein